MIFELEEKKLTHLPRKEGHAGTIHQASSRLLSGFFAARSSQS